MTMKQREQTNEVWQLEALFRRLVAFHPLKDMIRKDIIKMKKGARGEKEIEYPLGFLNVNQYLILHHLRLHDQNGYFQIDTLVMTEKYILILEVKSWHGTIVFHENGQVTRIGDDGEEEGFPNPIPQVKLQQHRLIKWLNLHTTSTIPLEFFVVISFPSTIIKSTPSTYSIPKEVIQNNQLFFKIQELDNNYPRSTLNINHLVHLANRLIEAHTPSTKTVLEKYNVSRKELLKGVPCPSCSTAPMTRLKGKWFCGKCQHLSKDAHLAVFNDYRLLISDKITNREARDFLQVNSPDVVKRLLQNAKYRSIGVGKARLYVLEHR